MYKILEKTQYSEKVFKFRIHAPQMAKHAHAGQFLMVRVNETGERVPFTFADWNPTEGWVEFIFMVIGKTTTMLSTLNSGDYIEDVVGPLGCPTDLGEGKWAVIGGGVGLAIAYPVARQLHNLGRECHAIMGARTKDLLLLEDQFRSIFPEDHIHITTDDGSYGEKGVVTAPLERLLQSGEVDHVFCVGPVPMMKFSARRSTGTTFAHVRLHTVPRRASPSRPMRRRTAHARSKGSLGCGHEGSAHARKRGRSHRACNGLPPR